MQIQIKLEQNGIMPSKEFPSAIGYDLYLPEDITVQKGRQIIPLNFRIKLPEGYGAFIFNRSGTSARGTKGLNIYDHFVECRFDSDTNLGLVDPTYTGIVGLLVHNHDMPFQLKRNDSIAQMVIIKCESPEFVSVEDFDLNTERGEQGFNA